MKEQKLYNKYLHCKHWEKHPTVYAEKFIDFLKTNNFKGLLVDIGCGNGRDINVFAKAGFDTLGVDYSKDEINLAKQKFPKLKFQIQNVERLGFDNDSIGAFFMINVIHYVDKEKAISEIFRTLKSGGYFFIHFNIEIKDGNGNIDYKDDEKDIMSLVDGFDILQKRTFERVDFEPVEHTHKIIELILRKPLLIGYNQNWSKQRA